MKVIDLKDKTSGVVIELEVVEVGEVRTWQRGDVSGSVRTAKCVDDNGEIVFLSLWHADLDRFKAGDKIRVVNGFCTFYEDPEVGLKKQLTIGKIGRIERIGG